MHISWIIISATLFGIVLAAEPGSLKDGFRCKKDEECGAGLSCIGPETHLRCKMKKGLGGQCGDPTWVCQPQFDCETKPGNRYGNCIQTMPEGDPCTGEWLRCAKGTKCINKKCTKPDYDDDDDYEEHEKPSPSPSPKVPPNEKPGTKTPPTKCQQGKTTCPEGLHCVGRKGHEICKKPMYEGESCRDITWVCAKGLDCIGKGKKAVCRKPAPPLKKKPELKSPHPKRKIEKETAPPKKKKDRKPKTKPESCTPGKKACKNGLHCVGRKGREVCKMPMTEGQSCHDITWVCAKGLECVGKGKRAICRKPAPSSKTKKRTRIQSKRCSGKCKKGFVCVTIKKLSKCLKLRGKGKKCGWMRNGGWCRRGLVCRRRRSGVLRCVQYLKSGSKCGARRYEICGRGSKCGTRNGKKICISVKGEKEKK